MASIPTNLGTFLLKLFYLILFKFLNEKLIHLLTPWPLSELWHLTFWSFGSTLTFHNILNFYDPVTSYVILTSLDSVTRKTIPSAIPIKLLWIRRPFRIQLPKAGPWECFFLSPYLADTEKDTTIGIFPANTKGVKTPKFVARDIQTHSLTQPPKPQRI